MRARTRAKSLNDGERFRFPRQSKAGAGFMPEIGEIVSFKEAVKMAVTFSDGAAIPYEKEEKNGIKEYANWFDR